MIFLERFTRKLTVAVMLKDILTPGEQVIGEVYLKAAFCKDPYRGSTGHFMLVDAPSGECRVIVGGYFYEEEERLIDMTGLNLQAPVFPLYLKPKANYPFPQGITVFKGRVVTEDDYKPVPGAAVTIIDPAEKVVSGADGWFFIKFDTVVNDFDISLQIVKDGFETKQEKLTVKKGVTTCASIVLVPSNTS